MEIVVGHNYYPQFSGPSLFLTMGVSMIKIRAVNGFWERFGRNEGIL